jgi:hypothetical protein
MATQRGHRIEGQGSVCRSGASEEEEVGVGHGGARGTTTKCASTIITNIDIDIGLDKEMGGWKTRLDE